MGRIWCSRRSVWSKCPAQNNRKRKGQWLVTIAEAFNIALGHHQGGRLNEAEPIYRQILAQEPQNSEILHLQGLLLHQRGKTAEGIALVERAVAIRRVPDYLANLAELLREQGDFERGIAVAKRL